MSKIHHAGHIEPAYHTPNQQRMFFASASDLGYTADEVKERAKKHFHVTCFNALTKENLKFLIDKLVQQQELRAAQKENEELKEYDNKKAASVRGERTVEERRAEAEKANQEMLDKI